LSASSEDVTSSPRTIGRVRPRAILELGVLAAFVLLVALVVLPLAVTWANGHPQLPGGSSRGQPSDTPVVSLAGGPGGVTGIITTSLADGSYSLPVGMAETVVISALPVADLARPPAPVSVTFVDQRQWQQLDFEYDTGIRRATTTDTMSRSWNRRDLSSVVHCSWVEEPTEALWRR
jgi:hypothetical protein